MGPAGQLVAVADAGPLIHLGELGQLRLLRVVDLLHIPDTVWSETVVLGRVSSSDLTSSVSFQRHAANAAQDHAFVVQHKLEHLHAGEVSALQLCVTLPAALVLTDDLAAREAARALGVMPIGSLGIVVRAYYRNFDLPNRRGTDLARLVSSQFALCHANHCRVGNRSPAPEPFACARKWLVAVACG